MLVIAAPAPPPICVMWYSDGPGYSWNCHPKREPQNSRLLAVSSAGISKCTIWPAMRPPVSSSGGAGRSAASPGRPRLREDLIGRRPAAALIANPRDQAAAREPDGDHGDAGGYARERQRGDERDAPDEAGDVEDPRPAAVLLRLRVGGGVRDRVVGEDAEGREADRAAEVGRQDENGGRRRDRELRVIGYAMAAVHRVEPAREVAVPRHREARSPEPRDQGEQRAEAGDGGADADERSGPRGAGGLDRGRERMRARGQGVRAGRRERGEADCGVDGDRDPERDRDRARDRPLGINDLFSERGDPRVAGEREEEEAGCLQGAVEAAVAERTEAAEIRGSGAAGQHGEEKDEQRQQRAGDQDSCEPRRARDPVVVDGREREHRGERDDALQPAWAVDGIGAEGERHRGARCGLADDEAPAGEEAPPLAEALAAVDVGAARGRILRRELRRGDGV